MHYPGPELGLALISLNKDHGVALGALSGGLDKEGPRKQSLYAVSTPLVWPSQVDEGSRRCD